MAFGKVASGLRREEGLRGVLWDLAFSVQEKGVEDVSALVDRTVKESLEADGDLATYAETLSSKPHRQYLEACVQALESDRVNRESFCASAEKKLAGHNLPKVDRRKIEANLEASKMSADREADSFVRAAEEIFLMPGIPSENRRIKGYLAERGVVPGQENTPAF